MLAEQKWFMIGTGDLLLSRSGCYVYTEIEVVNISKSFSVIFRIWLINRFCFVVHRIAFVKYCNYCYQFPKSLRPAKAIPRTLEDRYFAASQIHLHSESQHFSWLLNAHFLAIFKRRQQRKTISNVMQSKCPFTKELWAMRRLKCPLASWSRFRKLLGRGESSAFVNSSSSSFSHFPHTRGHKTTESLPLLTW